MQPKRIAEDFRQNLQLPGSDVPAEFSAVGRTGESMHPDRKIGIALGILLVGVVAALFFRNEPLVPFAEDSDHADVSSRSPSEASADGRHRSWRSAMTSDEEPEADEDRWTLRDLYQQLRNAEGTVPSPVTIASPDDSSVPADPDPDVPRIVFRPPVSLPAGERRDGGSASAPLRRADSERSDEPASGRSDSSKESLLADVPRSSGSESASGELQEYTVQYGDTLSGIAERFLGSQTRYQEIYELNRDRLPGPDRLQVGHSIRVPRQRF